MNLEKYDSKGYTGLANLGNTCFLNSCVQVLNHTYEFHAILDSPKTEKYVRVDLPDTQILREWNDLRSVMWSGNGVVSPNKFVSNVQSIAGIKDKDIFTGWAQNDMPEFLLFIMDCIHNSIARSVTMRINGKAENSTDKIAVECYNMLKTTYEKEYSEVMDLFYGVYISEIVSKDATIQHTLRSESYFVLDLPILDGRMMMNTLYDCFDLFTKSEVLDGENAWFNEKTGEKEDVQKRMSFWNFPKVLVIMLKRFTPDGRHRINSRVDFPLENLDLTRYVRGYNASTYVYDLYGVCNHSGNTMGGHYTAFVKHADQKWLHFNDTSVETVQSTQDIITPMAYCLFYRKKNNLV